MNRYATDNALSDDKYAVAKSAKINDIKCIVS